MDSETFDWPAYLALAAELVGLPVPDEYVDEIVAFLRLNRETVAPLLAFQMPEGMNIGPVFVPISPSDAAS